MSLYLKILGKDLREQFMEDRPRLFSGAQRQQAHTEPQKLPSQHRKHFFTLTVVKHQYRLAREVESPSSEIFKSYLNVVLINLLYMTLLEQGVQPSDL